MNKGSLWYRATQRGNIDAFDCTTADTVKLRGLAMRVSELAASEENIDKRETWKRHGSLSETRPLVICDPENGWNEIISLECEGESARIWETILRKKLFWMEQMGDDTPVEATLEIPYTYYESEWVEGGAKELITESGGHGWTAMMSENMTADDLTLPEMTVDRKRTQRVLDYANEVFANTIAVHLRGKWWHSLGLTNTLGELRGFEQVYYDLYDQPDVVSALMAKIALYNMQKLDMLERSGMLTLNNDMLDVPAGILGYTADLPQQKTDVTLNDMWGWFEAQELSEISPQMFEEFVFPYQKQLAERFGLISYGCCEPIEKRFETISTLRNLRRVSVSPWADKYAMAEMLGRNYLYAWKLNPAVLAVPNADPVQIRNDIEPVLRVLIRNDCRIEMVMKDNHTLGGSPENAIKWVQTAKEVIDNI